MLDYFVLSESRLSPNLYHFINRIRAPHRLYESVNELEIP
ncbi:hypothetical protein PCIT_a4401 [Pseudoalteromonas citrea]|uniref:Uncharacterized protein n=1 Tax=Pseudoalteromonas citrea TaxID=43655 RepID=A0AAD4AFV8_9GAMM|nr:hypothetical protein PCIT_a4401 [Pseudoalteromonas citrea]